MAGMNEYDAVIDELDNQISGRVKRTIYTAADSNPEQESALVKISRRSGIPVEALRLDDGAEAKRRIAAQGVEDLHAKAPATASFLSSPDNARLAHDDVEALAQLEWVAWQGFGPQGGSTMGIATERDKQTATRAKSIGAAFVEGLSASPERVSQGLATVPVVAADVVNWSLQAFPDETGMRKRFADTLRGSADYWKRAGDAKLGKTAPQSAESYFQQAGGSIGTSLLAAPFGMAGKDAALGAFALFADGGYQEMRNKGVNVPMAAALSTSSQAMEGLTEKIGLDALYKGSAPVLKKALGFLMGDLAGEEINTLYNALSDKVTIRPDMTMGDVLQQVVDAAIVTSIAGPAQGVSMSGAAKASETLFSQFEARQEAQRQSDFILALGEGVKATKAFKRLPSVVQGHLRKIKEEEGTVQDFYVPVESFTELFQSQGMDAQQAAEQILSDPKRYYEAVATGGDVAIPLEEYAVLADAPFYSELAKISRTSLTGMTAREAEAIDADGDSRLNELLQLAAEEAPEPDAYQPAYQQIYNDTYGQLIGINQSPAEAEANATIRAKGLATLAQRYGYDPAALMEQFPLKVTRGDLPAALQRQPSFTEQQQTAQLTSMLDAIRSGKGVAASEMFGPSLGEFLREKGVKDDRGDLAAMDVDKGIRFKKKMLRENGMSLDKAREAAVEAGYLPEGSDINALLDAVGNELKGQPVYSPGNENSKLVDQQLAHDELAQWLGMMGVDLDATGNDDILKLMQEAAGGDDVTLNQSKDAKRAYIKFGEGVPGFEIALLKDADASSFLHELGHYYEEILGRLAAQDNAPDTLKADYAAILNWLGATDKESLTVEQREKFARGFEAYLYEGNAPSQEMRGVFQRFKTWLKAVYSSLKSLNVELTDDVRAVFDRLLATDEEIAAAEREQNVKPIFTTAEEAGMSAATFEAYRKLAEQAHEDAKDRLEREKLKEVTRAHKAWWKEARAKMAEEVESEAKQNPVYEALNFLYTGKLFDGSTFEGESFKLSGAELRKLFDEPTAKAMRKRLGDVYRKEGGLHPAAVAEMFGFSSADEMVKKMMEVPKLKDFVKAETDRRMEEAHGKMTGAEIAEEAINAVHNEKQAELFKEELKALQRKAKGDKGQTPVEFYKQAARRHVATLKVSEILPGKYARAEAKAGNQAIVFASEGKFAEAAAAKQRQLLNHYLYREAVAAKAEADKIASYMRGLEDGKKQRKLGKAGQDYLDQVNDLLDRYEFRRQTAAVLEERERLIDWVERMEKRNGFPPPIPPSVLEDAMQTNYRTLSMERLRDVGDAAKAIVFLANVEGKLLKVQEGQEIHELALEAKSSIEFHSRGKKPRLPEKDLPQDRPGRMMENYFASHRKMSSLARQMDGGQDGGVMWNLLIRPMNEAGDREAVMRAEAATNLNKLFSVYSSLERTRMHRREFIPEIDTSISRWGRIVVALNMGNEGNRQRLGSMYDAAQVDAIVQGLDERDWQFVQNVWNLLQSYWPEIEAKEKRVNGVAPQAVEHTPVQTKFGPLQGGYWPIKYDAEETAKAGAQQATEILQQMMGGAFTRATTRHGHTEARLEAVNRPLTLSIDVLFQHLNQVIHDLTHHEMLYDVNRLLGTVEIQEAIRDHYGMEAYRVFTEGVKDVAVGDLPAQDTFERFMNYTRIGISTAGLGWNLTTSLMQPLGLTQSMVRIGPKWVGKGISRWVSSPKHMVETAEWIYGKSEFMQTRSLTINREINEIRNQMTVGVIPHAVRDSFFYFIQQMQKVVDIPTWLGQYEKSMAAHGNEADAIAESDQAVIDSQASGMMKDLAGIQKGGPMKKMFTTFYSFFSTTYNLAAESKARTSFKNPAEVGRFLVDMLLLYTVPAVLSTLIKEAIQHALGGGGDDDELLKKLAGDQLGYIMGGFIGLREMGSLFSGYQGYEGPAGSRVYASTIKLAKQLEQGEADEALFKALNNTGGILLHYPAGQVQRTTQGVIELANDRGNLLSLMFGKPKQH